MVRRRVPVPVAYGGMAEAMGVLLCRQLGAGLACRVVCYSRRGQCGDYGGVA
jgi:hypothetical protein